MLTTLTILTILIQLVEVEIMGAKTDDRDRQVLEQRIGQAVSRLDDRARRALLNEPDAIYTVLDATARRLSEKGRVAPERLGSRADDETLSPADARAWIEARTIVRPVDDELVGAGDVATLLGLGSRQAVHGRRARGALVGFVNGRRDVLFPRAQFDERGRVVPGLADVLAVFDGEAYEAWSWLTASSAALDDDVPLERLRSGDIEIVIAAARGHLQGDFG